MIKVLTTQDRDYHKLLDLRHQVLRKPLGMDIYDDDLTDEPACQHLAYYGHNDTIIACLKIKSLGQAIFQIMQMAVLPDYQGRRVGAALLTEAENIIRQQGGIKIIIESRDYAIPFYVKSGYRQNGSVFEKIGIPHQRMIKTF